MSRRELNQNIIKFKIGFSSQLSMIFILTHIFCGTNHLWLAQLHTPAFAYLLAARELKASARGFHPVAGHRRYF